jgi:hypothetical protein
MGMGYHTRGNPQLCLLAARGKGVQRLRRDVGELIIAPRRQHSQKPDEAYDQIERLWPGPYLELFARNRRPGWQAMGNEVDSGPITQRRWPSNSYPAQASLELGTADMADAGVGRRGGARRARGGRRLVDPV